MRAQAAVPQRFARLHAAPAREYVEEARGAQLLDQVADLALRGEGGGDEWDEGGLLVQRLVEVLQAKEDGVLLCEGSVKFGLVDKKATRFYFFFFIISINQIDTCHTANISKGGWFIRLFKKHLKLIKKSHTVIPCETMTTH